MPLTWEMVTKQRPVDGLFGLQASPLGQWNAPSSKRCPPACEMPRKPWQHALADVPRPVCPLWSQCCPWCEWGVAAVTPGPAPASSATHPRESCWLLAGLCALLGFLRLRKPLLYAVNLCSTAEHACTSADRLSKPYGS